MLLRTAALVLGALFLPDAAFGQEAPWTDLAVRTAARRRAPEVARAVSDARVAQSEQTFGTLSVVGNPVVSVLFLPGFPDEGALTGGATVAFPIEVSGERGRWQRETARSALAAEDRIAAASTRAEAAARMARVDVALAEALTRLQSTRLATARDNEARVRARVQAGATTAVDESLAVQERAEAEASLADAERTRVERLTAFRHTLDLDPAAPVEVQAAAPPAREDPARIDALVAEALLRRRDIVAHQHASARWGLADARLAASSVAPLLLGVEAQTVSVSPGHIGSAIGASVRWELPLIQHAQGPRAVARAESERELALAQMLRREVAREVDGATRALDWALQAHEAIEARAIPAAETLVRDTEASWTAGALDYFRVISARRELLTLQARAIDALRVAWQARIDLDRALGGAL